MFQLFYMLCFSNASQRHSYQFFYGFDLFSQCSDSVLPNMHKLFDCGEMMKGLCTVVICEWASESRDEDCWAVGFFGRMLGPRYWNHTRIFFYHRITESQNGRSWKGRLWVI